MIRAFYRRLRRDRRGTIAIITAIVIFPLLFLAIGVPIDLARTIQIRSAMQNFDDAAAIAGEADIANGATAGQACTLVYTMGASLIFAPGGGLSNFGAGASTAYFAPGSSSAQGVSCDNSPQITTTTAPNSVTVTGVTSLPTTFTSFLKSTIPISTTATAMGPQGFITICVTPTSSGSSDINQAYYYFRNPNGTYVNQDGTSITTADYPGLNTGPTSNIPTLGSGVELSAFLTDNAEPTAHGPVAANGYCDAADTQVAVTLKNGLGQRLGFEFVNITGAQYPCYYNYYKNRETTSMTCLSNNTNYNYNPTSSSYSLTGGNANGFESYYLTYTTPTNPLIFATNAYGSFIGQENLFYSTDYPNSYATSNLNSGIVNGASLITSPIANNSCYELTPILGALSPTINGYGATSQGCLLSQAANAVATSYGAPSGGTVTFGANNNGQTGYLVCLAQDGATRLNGTAYTPSIVSGGGYVHVTGTNGVLVQQENMTMSNSSTTSPSLGSNIYQCPVNTIGSPYYPDPTCAELKGATLDISWNDMGGFEEDNGNGPAGNSPGDLFYSYSCQPPTPGALTETALTQ